MFDIEIQKLIRLEKGEIDSFPIAMQPIDEVAKVLEALNYEEQPIDESTNGWQVDFWYKFTNKDKEITLMLSGSLWYGDFRLSIDEYTS